MNRLKPWPAVLAFLFLASGCSGLLTSDQPARQYYLLQPVQLSAPASAGAGDDLALDVTAIPGLDTDQLLALGPDARLQQYGNARWPDHLPEVLTSTLQRSLESTGRFGFVSASDSARGGSWLLQLEAREFYGILDSTGNTSRVRFALDGSVSCAGMRHALKLSDSQPVGVQRVADVVAAHQAALDAVTRQLFERLAQLCPAGTAQ